MKIKDLLNINSRENRMIQLRIVSEQELDTFSEAIFKTVIKLKKKIAKYEEKTSELQGEITDYHKDNNKIPTKADIENYGVMYDCYYEIQLYNEYLKSFAEMKIVYFFKSLEINMKTLITIAYPNVRTNSFYNWENMSTFFKSRDIIISEIIGYQETVELRKTNNCIKHRDIISDEIKKINEFQSIEIFTQESIDLFHQRIKSKVSDFYKGLTNEVIKDLYEFDTARLENLAEEYSNRMGDSELKLFINLLTKKLI